MSLRKILVVGSTGKQGSAFVRAAAAHRSEDSGSSGSPSSPNHRFHIIALTRNPASPAAKELLALGDNVSVAAGDLNDAASIRKVFEDEKAKFIQAYREKLNRELQTQSEIINERYVNIDC